jgi:MFS family permease
LQNVRHFDANTTGLMMLSIAGFGIISTPLAGRWIDRSGPKPGLLFSSSMMLAGSLLLLSVQDDSSKGWMFFVFSVLGICNGFNNLGLQTALYAFVPRSQTGAASGLFMTSRYMGTILSSSLLGNVFGQTITTGQLHEMAWICAGLGGLILFLSIRMPGTHFGMEKAAR